MPKNGRTQSKPESFKLDYEGPVREWLDNQENKTFSVNTALYYIAKQFGTGDFLKSLAEYNAKITTEGANVLISRATTKQQPATNEPLLESETNSIELPESDHSSAPNLDFLSTNQPDSETNQ